MCGVWVCVGGVVAWPERVRECHREEVVIITGVLLVEEEFSDWKRRENDLQAGEKRWV